MQALANSYFWLLTAALLAYTAVGVSLELSPGK